MGMRNHILVPLNMHFVIAPFGAGWGEWWLDIGTAWSYKVYYKDGGGSPKFGSWWLQWGWEIWFLLHLTCILSLFPLGGWGKWCFDIGTIWSCKIDYKDGSGSSEPRSW
jgi:hypothetical protein